MMLDREWSQLMQPEDNFNNLQPFPGFSPEFQRIRPTNMSLTDTSLGSIDDLPMSRDPRSLLNQNMKALDQRYCSYKSVFVCFYHVFACFSQDQEQSLW